MVDYVFLTGKAKWFKHQLPNKFGNWSHDIYLNDESLERVKELKQDKGKTEGIKNNIKHDEDGDYISLNRPQQKMMRGKVVGFTPPILLDRNDEVLYDVAVGNGSDITTKLEYYTYKKPFGEQRGSAIRWAST